MSALNLVMPMAGRGSRFARQGILEPKPLIELNGKPFFWWAVESVRRVAKVEQMVFVVLQEHVDRWSIDQCIHQYYQEADIVVLPEVTAGSAQTAALGIEQLRSKLPLAINDCDHAFLAPDLAQAAARLEAESAGALVTFRASSPNYSYVILSPSGKVVGTVEKQVASDFAIAGCYLFRSPALFHAQYARYMRECPYAELFLSGIYNQMLADQMPVDQLVLEEHFAFGTPEEYADVQSRMAARLSGWR